MNAMGWVTTWFSTDITHVQEGGFYGWPWWYMGKYQDPRYQGKHPELKDKVITLENARILNPHNASLDSHFLRRQTIPGRVFRATFSLPSSVDPGTGLFAWVMS